MKKLSVKSKIDLLKIVHVKKCSKYNKYKSQDKDNQAIQVLKYTAMGHCEALRACIDLLENGNKELLYTLS